MTAHGIEGDVGTACHIDTVHITGMTRLTGRPAIGLSAGLGHQMRMSAGALRWTEIKAGPGAIGVTSP